MRFTGSVHWGAVTALAFCLLALLVAAERPEPIGGGAGTAAPSQKERLLTSDNPGDHSILNSLFKRLLGSAKCEKLPHTGSEVWTVPHSKLASLKERLVSVGIKFAVLREGWNHILRRNTTPMSAAQKEMLAKAGRSRETVGMALMRAPERPWRNMP